MTQPRISFKLSILVLFAVLTIGLSAVILYVNYSRNSEAVVVAADNLLELVASRVHGATERLIEPLIALISLMPEKGVSATDANDIAPVLFGAFARYPHMASAYIGNGNGDFFRIAALEGDREAARDFLQAPRDAMYAVQTIERKGEGPHDAQWRFLDINRMQIGARTESATTYDPRTRPWYGAALATSSVIVTDYYAFASVPSVGLTVARRLQGDGKEVFATDITLSSVSKFLNTIRDSLLANVQGAEIAIFHRDGRVLAHSDRPAYERLLNSEKTPRVPMAGEFGSPVLRSIVERGHGTTPSSVRLRDAAGVDWLTHVAPLPQDFGNGSYLAIAVPLEAFLGPLARSARETLLVSILVMLAFLPLVYWSANVISKPLMRLTGEIEQLRHLEIGGTARVSSMIAEIQDLASALATSKFMLGAFGKYVPKSLVQQMMESGIEPAIDGERRPVTVFFSDVRDFTTMSEELPPERLMKLTSEYLEGLVDIIIENRGTVDKFVGDQIMAYWNAPTANPNHIVDGCLAVLRCRDWSNRKNTEWEAAGRPILYTRFALHAGDAVVGNVGSSDRMDYTVVGNTINLGSRLEGLNKIYGTQVLVSDPVADAIAGKFAFRPIDRVLPKGAVFPLGLYELRGAHPDWAETPADLVVDRDDVRMCARWTEVYELYLKRDWTGLIRAIDAFVEEFGDDSVATLYMDRAVRFTMEPPEDDWDGVIRYSEK